MKPLASILAAVVPLVIAEAPRAETRLELTTPLQKLRVRKIRGSSVVFELPDGSLVVAKEGSSLGDQREKVVSIEKERITLKGTREERGKRIQSWVLLTWNADGVVREQRIESFPEGAVRWAPPLESVAVGNARKEKAR